LPRQPLAQRFNFQLRRPPIRENSAQNDEPMQFVEKKKRIAYYGETAVSTRGMRISQSVRNLQPESCLRHVQDSGTTIKRVTISNSFFLNTFRIC
jgi:hypothetical protein